MNCTATPTAPETAKRRPVLSKRKQPERSQKLRFTAQMLFLALNVWIGVEFVMFVRYFESAGDAIRVSRPSGVEGWLPIASLMNLKALLLTGELPPQHAAGMFLLIAFLAISFLLRKSFCSWLCPVGTVSEWLWKAGRAIFGRNWQLPRWADIPLRSLKYVLLGLFVYAVGSMSAVAIRMFLDGPYGLIADVKMLNFFRYMSVTGAVVVGILIVLSIAVKNFWCRYLCPYGALLGLFAGFSPIKVRRSTQSCTDCGKCATVCPSLIPVDKLLAVRTPECTGCYECVASCPAEGALEMTAPGGRKFSSGLMLAAVSVIFLGVVGYAQLSGNWETHIPDETYFDLIPRANEFGHP